MNAFDLMGEAAAASLEDRLKDSGPDEAVARFMLDRLTGAQVAAIVAAILRRPALAAKTKIAVPRELVDGYGLPDDVVTDERTLSFRHSDPGTAALLLANTDDDQGTSLSELTLLGAKQLIDEPSFWVQSAAHGLGLPSESLEQWEAALRGLTAADNWSLQQVASFVELTRQRIEEQSEALVNALGWALPALHLPRDSGYFKNLKPKDLGQSIRWKKQFEKLVSDRKPLLAKQRPSRQPIEAEELRTQFEQVRDEIPSAAYADILSFIEAPPGWGPSAEALTLREYEADNIIQIFSGLRQKKTSLAEETQAFFDMYLPESLSDLEHSYLKALRERSIRDPQDEDRDFFDAHREDMTANRALRAKWDKFILGRPIECTDLLEGLLSAVERLYGQTSNIAAQPRSLVIKSARRTPGQWLDLNADVGKAFSVRYRGLPALMGGHVTWDTPHLFNYEVEVIDRAKRRRSGKYRKNESVSRASLQIKFDVALTVGGGSTAERNVVQLIWMGQPNAIGLELPGDLVRLANRSFVRAQVARQPVSRKGALQSVSLHDVGTLQPAFGQDSGSLTPRATVGEDVAKSVPLRLRDAEAAGRLTAPVVAEIDASWTRFRDAYAAAILAWRTAGLATGAFFAQAEAYAELLTVLGRHANTDLLRRDLWQPILAIGCIEITGAVPSAIIAPWHPMRLAAMAVKLHGLTGLANHLLSAPEPNFGDARLFFSDLRSELAHPFYPEICVGYAASEPVLLTETSTVNDYSLMERPVRDASEAATDVDPGEAARQIRTLVQRYIDLQPHESANLSIMLYNCDAAGLALASVSALGAVQDQDQDQMQCNVLVRHRDRPKLAGVYTELLERAEGDPDAVVVSETSRNFMSKLRIGVMLEGASVTPGDFRPVDIAFLHDVVSRQAKVGWFRVPAGGAEPELLDHVPARWSYRRVTAEDELKATTYLACPRQPKTGWAYLDAVAAIFAQEPAEPGAHYLPARQISFQDHEMKSMFDEVHGLAEWVATYDDLLDKRQLAALNIQVIRYRRQRTHGRNMVVSSTSELRVLHVLVLRRLSELSLGLTPDRLDALARRLIDEAAAISGDIVLRAAKQGVSAGELIGLVLSRALVAQELGATGAAWYLLDDYAEWLGQREQGLADILALAVAEDDACRPVLRVVVTEAKYTSAKGLADSRRKSRLQLRHTLQRMEEALFGDPGRLDRDLWLSRIADLLLDGVAALGSTARLEQVRDGIRAGIVPIDMRGYSHIFVSGPADESPDLGEQEEMTDFAHGLQEVFTREALRQLLKTYEQRGDLLALRAKLGSSRIWTEGQARPPAPRVNWVAGVAPTAAPAKAAALPPEQDDEETEEAPRPRVKTYDMTPEEPAAKPAPAPSASRVTVQAAAPPVAAVDPAAAAPPPPQAVEGSLANLVASRAEAKGASPADLTWLEETAQKLRSALLGYSLQAKIVDTRLTPNAALVRFLGSDRLRVQDLEARKSALLTTHGLRLISISPLEGGIVVGVARPNRQVVSLWDVWARRQINRNPAGVNASLVLGLRELDGEILYLNLGGAFGGGQAHEPHTLVAGATGSGKSVLIQALILDIAATNPSRLAQIHLIDPKMGVDYAALERLPHVQGGGAVIDQARAIEVLQGLVVEMDRRYGLFRAQGARDIRTFNMKAPAEARLPMVFLVHDEFAEWMLSDDYKEAVAANVSRLGVKARAAGIHLIFAAQRPDANVMPIQLRDNLGNRLILKVASVGTSEIALGQPGAEQLLGSGHLAARLNGEPDIVFAQAPFLSDDDIDAAVDAIIAGDAALLDAVWPALAAAS